ncbi:hypothetical protein QE152_g31377 [Popillia japonica]|uniref:Transmembrane protein n=1 Tax=Popillia japonica TaxID=7064 RepID=A0AAW1J1Z7_POPJA
MALFVVECVAESMIEYKVVVVVGSVLLAGNVIVIEYKVVVVVGSVLLAGNVIVAEYKTVFGIALGGGRNVIGVYNCG